jgi:hypothetical protein
MKKPIEIYIPIYKVTVIMVFGWTKEQILKCGKEHGVKEQREMSKWIDKNIDTCSGFCVRYGDGNRDILIWLKKYPESFKEYGVVYHELYHAIDFIAYDIDPETMMSNEGSSEARAFLFEYIINEANRVLWNMKFKEIQKQNESSTTRRISKLKGIRRKTHQPS